MKSDLRISIEDYHRKKNLQVLGFRPPFPCRGLLVLMKGALTSTMEQAGIVWASEFMDENHEWTSVGSWLGS
jgi:hypothetical protein